MMQPIRFDVKDFTLGFLFGVTLVMTVIFYKIDMI